MIDFTQENVLMIGKVPEVLPRIRRGRRLSKSALYRWIRRRVEGITLEVIQIDETSMTSTKALQRLGNHQPQLKEHNVEDAEVKL